MSVPEVRAVIRALVIAGCPSIRRTAARLGLSIRSLQRILTRNGTTHSDLLDDVRFELARNLLRDPSQKLIGISRRLGYRDPSSFSRAFARWTRCSPREYRATRIGRRG